MLTFVEVEQAIKQMSDEERERIKALLESLRHEAETTKLSNPRQPGLFSGVWMSDDFNDELPDSFWFGDDES